MRKASRPNLNERTAAACRWSGFVRAFDAKDIEAETVPPFLDDLIWGVVS